VSEGEKSRERAVNNGQANPLAREVGEAASSGLARPVYPDQATESAAGTAAQSAGAEQEPAASGAAEEPQRRPIRRPIHQKEPEPLDLGEASREAVMKRVWPVVVGVGVLAVVFWLLRRRS
jgi:hypothetical protein